MDQFNVITPTSDLDELNNDMVSWTRLPLNLRYRSDEECIRRYNMTNIDLYNNLKAMIINNTVPKDDMMLSNSISEGAMIQDNSVVSFLNDEEKDFIIKKQKCEQLEMSPNIVIISPFRGDNKEYTLDELEDKFLKYSMLIDKHRRFSNSYSLSIWGYDVPNMYQIMKKKIMSLDGIESDDIIFTMRESVEEKLVTPLYTTLNEMIINQDILGLYNMKMDSFNEMTNTQRAMYNDIVSKIDETVSYVDFLSVLPKKVPYFTLTEMRELGIDDSNINTDYFHMNEEELLQNGWNPSVPVTEESLEYARRRQNIWLNEHKPKIVDLTHYNFNIVNESSTSMNRMYKKYDLYPIYIVISYTGTLMSKIIKFVRHSQYAHAGLSLDSDLRAISTFQLSKEWKGFANDSLDKYIKENSEASIMVLALFVDYNTKYKIDMIIKDFISKQEKSKYNVKNLFNVLLNKSVDNDSENLYLICSQFVDTVLKLANIKLFNKSSNLVEPEDFKEVANNPKVYKVYEGLARKYNEKEVEDIIHNLFITMNTNVLQYSNTVNEASITLEAIKDLLTPESVLVERKLPIKLDDNGNLELGLYKSLEEQYQEAHRLLKEYNDSNIEPMKHELARLFYINSAIEKKIKKMKKDDKEYKKYIDLRARVLNDFKKYFKIVLDNDPEFNFTEYFKKSEYYNGNIIIDNSVLKYTGKMIKEFIKMILGQK